MPEPISLCLEDLSGKPGSVRYTMCVAIRGGEPGLGVDCEGKIAWQAEGPLACELWISADERLILLRPEGAPPLRMSRAGRSLQVPCGKPVVLVDQDTLHTACGNFRLHVHGPAAQISPPAPYRERHNWARLAATVAIGVAAVSCHKSDPGNQQVEVREHPPAPPPYYPPDASSSDAAATDGGDDAGAADAALEGGARPDAGWDAARKSQPIEIRHDPPKPAPRDPSGF